MNEKFNKNAKVEQLAKVVLSHGEEKGLIVKDPLSFLVSAYSGRLDDSNTRHEWAILYQVIRFYLFVYVCNRVVWDKYGEK